MKRSLISFVCIVLVFVCIGYGVKKYVEGPSQPVNSILVTGTEENVNVVKKLYQDDVKETKDYKYKRVQTDETYTVTINKSTAKQLIEKGILRERKDAESTSIISVRVKEMLDLKSKDNLYFAFSEADKVKLDGQDISVKHVKPQAWIGYGPKNMVILNDDIYDSIKVEESNLALIKLKRGGFDYKNKDKILDILDKISKVYPDSKEYVNFADVR